MESQYHTSGRPAPARFSAAFRAVGALVAVLCSGCGTKIDTPVPDIATKDDRPVMSSAEQRQAVEALIAKRDSTAASQKENTADPKAAKAKQQPAKSQAQAQADKASQSQDASK